MDTILLAVTVLSLAMAAGMAILVATLLRQERAPKRASERRCRGVRGAIPLG